MKNSGQPIDLSVLDAIRARERTRAEIAREICKLEDQIRAERQKTHLDYVEQLAKEAGVDLEAIREDARRRNKVQQRVLEKGYEEIRAKAKKLVQEEAEHLRAVREAYVACHKEAIDARQGNPELKFILSVEGGDTANVDLDPPGGMVGYWCREPVFAEREYSDDMEVGGEPPDYRLHHFYPRAYARAGDDDQDVWVHVRQTVTLRRHALESGEGNFRVDRVRVNLSGVGYSEGREGRAHGFTYPITGVRLQVKVMQTGPTGFLEATPIEDEWLYSGWRDHAEPARIELGSRMFSCDFDILNPDNGGSEPWVYVTLITSSWAEYEDARAEIDFSRPGYGGLELGCVSLFGDYL
jgi:hypothetical protein